MWLDKYSTALLDSSCICLRVYMRSLAVSQLHDAVREKYGAVAKAVGDTGCCAPTACGCGDPISSNLYSDRETAGLPPDAVAASLGCGNPTALLPLEAGQ